MANSMTDLVVVIPGIMVSTPVDSEGKELWGVKPGILLRSIVRVRRNFQKLRLPAGRPASATRSRPMACGRGRSSPFPMSSVSCWAPTATDASFHRWSSESNCASQGSASSATSSRSHMTGAFPVGSTQNASRRNCSDAGSLADRYRQPGGEVPLYLPFDGRPRAALVHRGRGWPGTHSPLITIGTSTAAEEELRLANGFDPGFGPLRLQLTESIRSLPSAHQLLPTCNCVETADGPKRISEVPIPDMDTAMLADALTFHERIQESAKTGAPDG